MKNKTLLLLLILLTTFSLSQSIFSQNPFDMKIVTVSGKIEAASGDVTILGDTIKLYDAFIDVSGETAGRVRIGGDYLF